MSKQMEQQVKRELRFKLTPEERNKMANKAAELSKERDKDQAELKEIKATYGSRIKTTQGEIDRLLDCHLQGTEAREVECTERFDWETEKVTYLYNNEVMSERKMEPDELQMRMDTNPTARRPKGVDSKRKKNDEKNLTPEEIERRRIAEVHRSETSRFTKKSSVDPQPELR